MNDSYAGRVLRLIRFGLATTPGFVVLVVAVVAAVALFADDAAARIIGLIALAVAAAAALAWAGRVAKPETPPRSRPQIGVTTSEDPTLEAAADRARARLQQMAHRLELAQPSAPESSSTAPVFEPLVTVIVPVFNDERYVEAALESVRRQSYRNWECVIVDDASSDDSLRLIETSVGSDSRFRIIRQERNLGPGGSRNRGIAEAQGRYLAFLDADDLLLAESLTDRVAAIAIRADDPYLAGSFCAVRFSPEEVALDELPDRRHATQPGSIDFVTADGECPFTMIAPLVSTELVRSVGGLDESMRSGGVDWDLWYRILRNGYVFVPSRTLGAVYRQRGGGITRGNPAAHTGAAARLIRAAHQPADPAVLAKPSPYPLREPLGVYRSRLTVAERAVRFAAMALVDGDREGMESTLSHLDPGTWPLLERHLELPALVARGAARSLGVRPRHLETLGEELAPFVSEVGEAVRAASK